MSAVRAWLAKALRSRWTPILMSAASVAIVLASMILRRAG